MIRMEWGFEMMKYKNMKKTNIIQDRTDVCIQIYRARIETNHKDFISVFSKCYITDKIFKKVKTNSYVQNSAERLKKNKSKSKQKQSPIYTKFPFSENLMINQFPK